MTKQWFITATDTGAGKTFASCTLLRAARAAGLRCAGYKPVAAGCELTAQGLRNSDALALLEHSHLPLDYAQVNPVALQAATSPHIASQRQGQPVEFSQLTAGLVALSQQADWVLVEGAGGWYTPLTDSQTFAEWVTSQRLPVILVVPMKLGCINHALLTMQAIASAGLPLVAWIANQIVPPEDDYSEYLETLKRWLNTPLLGEIPYCAQGLPPLDCLSLDLLRVF